EEACRDEECAGDLKVEVLDAATNDKLKATGSVSLYRVGLLQNCIPPNILPIIQQPDAQDLGGLNPLPHPDALLPFLPRLCDAVKMKKLDKGIATFTDLEPGRYRVVVSAKGYRVAQKRTILRPKKSATLSVSLKKEAAPEPWPEILKCKMQNLYFDNIKGECTELPLVKDCTLESLPDLRSEERR